MASTSNKSQNLRNKKESDNEFATSTANDNINEFPTPSSPMNLTGSSFEFFVCANNENEEKKQIQPQINPTNEDMNAKKYSCLKNKGTKKT